MWNCVLGKQPTQRCFMKTPRITADDYGLRSGQPKCSQDTSLCMKEVHSSRSVGHANCLGKILRHNLFPFDYKISVHALVPWFID